MSQVLRKTGKSRPWNGCETGLITCELRDGKYNAVADVTGDEEFSARAPFQVALRPGMLVTTGPLPGHRSAR